MKSFTVTLAAMAAAGTSAQHMLNPGYEPHMHPYEDYTVGVRN